MAPTSEGRPADHVGQRRQVATDQRPGAMTVDHDLGGVGLRVATGDHRCFGHEQLPEGGGRVRSCRNSAVNACQAALAPQRGGVGDAVGPGTPARGDGRSHRRVSERLVEVREAVPVSSGHAAPLVEDVGSELQRTDPRPRPGTRRRPLPRHRECWQGRRSAPRLRVADMARQSRLRCRGPSVNRAQPMGSGAAGARGNGCRVGVPVDAAPARRRG